MRKPEEPGTGGVLSSLPSTRPQHRSPKRRATTSPADSTPQASPLAAEPQRERRPTAAQGYEPDTARGAVDPPSRADLLGSVGAGAAELAHLGLSLSARLVRSVLDRLPG